MLLTGCDQVPWKSHEDSTASPSATTTPASQPAAVPVFLIPEAERVASVNDATLSMTDMELAVRELKQVMQAYQQPWQPLPAEERADALDLHDLLNNLIETELKAQDAKSRGLNRRTEIQRRYAYLERAFYAQEWDRWQREQAASSEDDIHRFYEQNKAGFVEPERIRLNQIVTETLAQAEAARAQAVQGAVFAQLALEQSVGPGKEQGGDIGWFLRALDHERLRLLGSAPTEGVLFPQLEPVAFALDANQVSQPVKGPDGKFYIVQLVERKTARQQTELEVRDAIRELLLLQRRQQQLEELRRKARLTEFKERLGNVPQ
jgi:peptidyl-prolyl cis-trans isomerase C